MADTARHRRVRRTGSAAAHHSPRSHREQPLKPIVPPILPPPLPSLPREDGPVERPRKAVPLIKTEYNAKQLRKLSIVGGAILLVGVGGIALLAWQHINHMTQNSQIKSPDYKLTVSTEKVDASKAQLVLQQIRQSTTSAAEQATSSASPTPSAIPGQLAIPSAGVLQGYSSTQLLTILDSQIEQLQSEKQSTRTLDILKASGSKSDILRAIQLGKEYQALYLYYKK